MLALVIAAASSGRGAVPGRASVSSPDSFRKAHLVRAPAVVVTACRELATEARHERVRLTVYCPPVVPDVLPIKVETLGGILRYHHLTDGYQASFFSPTARWATHWGGHWTFAAGRASSLRVYIHPPQAPVHPLRVQHLMLAQIPGLLHVSNRARLLRRACGCPVAASWRELRHHCSRLSMGDPDGGHGPSADRRGQAMRRRCADTTVSPSRLPQPGLIGGRLPTPHSDSS